jgi:rapamycin-insensitive companion of mTOR
MLFQHPEGLKILEEHKFFAELGDCLMQVVQATNTSQTIFFSKERLERSMSSEYFTILGLILNHPTGVRVLEDYRIINVLYSLTLIKNRDDIAMLMVSKFDCDR